MLFAITLKNFERADLKTLKENVFCIFNKHAPIKNKIFSGKRDTFYDKRTSKSNYEKIKAKKKVSKK